MSITDFSFIFVDLYNRILAKEKNIFSVSDQRIRDGIKIMKEVYMPNPLWQLDQVVSVANYNDPAHRCAYLHKYSMCYTGMVCDLLQMAILNNSDIYELINSKRRLTLCSLGGGPGTDIIGSLAAIFACCQYIPCSATILDYSEQWRKTFDLLIQELRCGRGFSTNGLKEMVSAPHFKYEYMNANLLVDVAKKSSVRQMVNSADFLTMVKFISAAACQSTCKMVEDIFNCMKPGAMLLFIDNAAGGFQEMLQKVALQCGMVTVFGPLQHYDYENTKYSINRFNYTSQSKTKIAFQIWWKPQTSRFNTTQELRNDYFSYNRLYTQGEENVRVLRPNQRTQTIRQQPQPEEEGGCCSII